MFKKFLLIISIALGLVISGCASFRYETRPFFKDDFKLDCGNGKKAASYSICYLDSFGY